MINPEHQHHEQTAGTLLGIAIFTAPAAVNLIRYGWAKAKGKTKPAKTKNTSRKP